MRRYIKRTRSIFSRFVQLSRFLLTWGVLAAVVCAIVGGVYVYHRADEAIRRHVESILARHYKGLTVSVRSARLLEREGFEIRGISISAPAGRTARTELAYFDEVLVRCQPTLQDLWDGNVRVRDIVVRRATVRSTRKPDGTWSTDSLFPLPRLSNSAPRTVVENATVEIIDSLKAPSSLLTLRDVNLRLAPDAPTASEQPATGEGQRRIHVEGTLSGDHFQRAELRGNLDLDRGTWTLSGNVAQLEVTPELRRSLPADLARHLSPLGPLRTRATFQFELSSGSSGQQAVEFSLSGHVSEGRLDDPRLSYPVTDLQADVQCDRHGLKVKRLTARYGSATVALDYLRQGHGPGSPMTLQGQARRLRVDRKSIDMLPDRLRSEWERFQPLGVVDADFRFDFDGLRWVPGVSVNCADVTIECRDFPYPLQHGTGHLVWTDDVIWVDLRTHAGDRPVHVQGHVEHPGPYWSGWLQARSEDRIPLDDRLIAAHNEPSRRILLDFNPRGWVRFFAKIERESAPGAPVHRRIEVDLEDCSVRHAKFPYPLQGVRGKLTMTDGEWTFADLVGHNDSGYVTCQGHWDPHDDPAALSLDFEATDVPLEDELRDALSPQSKKLWLGLRPRGSLDHLSAALRYFPRQKELNLDVDLHKWARDKNTEGGSLSVTPIWFPYRLDDVTGTVRFHDGRAELRGIKAKHGPVTIQLSGNSVSRPEGHWHLRLDRLLVDRLRTDRDFVAALPNRLHEAISKLNLTGPINVEGELAMSGSQQPGVALACNWDLTLNAADARINCAVTLDHVWGDVRLVGGSQGVRFQSRGELTIDSLVYKGIQWTQMQGPLWIDNAGLRLGEWAEPTADSQPPRRLSAELFGGTAEGSARVFFDQNGQFDLAATLTDADLTRVVRETSRRPSRVKGRAYASLRLEGTSRGVHTLRGNGQVALREADIYELPLTLALLKALSSGNPDRAAFTDSDISFHVSGDNVYFDEIGLSGDAFSLKGVGYMSLDRQIKLDFYSVLGRQENYLPDVLPLLGEASRRFLLIEVTGTLEEPETVGRVLPGLNDTLQRLFPEIASRPPNRAMPINSPIKNWLRRSPAVRR